MAPPVNLNDPATAAKVATVGMVVGLVDTMAKTIGALRLQVADLTKRIEAFETSPLKYDGPHETRETPRRQKKGNAK